MRIALLSIYVSIEVFETVTLVFETFLSVHCVGGLYPPINTESKLIRVSLFAKKSLVFQLLT